MRRRRIEEDRYANEERTFDGGIAGGNAARFLGLLLKMLATARFRKSGALMVSEEPVRAVMMPRGFGAGGLLPAGGGYEFLTRGTGWVRHLRRALGRAGQRAEREENGTETTHHRKPAAVHPGPDRARFTLNPKTTERFWKSPFDRTS